MLVEFVRLLEREIVFEGDLEDDSEGSRLFVGVADPDGAGDNCGVGEGELFGEEHPASGS